MVPPLREADRVRLLWPPPGRLRVVIDTDTFNEVDDQFAVVYALQSPARLSVEAIYAAPFTNERAATAAEGMRQSHAELLRLLALMRRSPDGLVHEGALAYLSDAVTPVASPAVRDLIERGMRATADAPLFVVALAAPTNVANALLIEPRLAGRLVVVWLGGHALFWPHTNEFNLRQDLRASRLLLDSGVPLVLMPCNGVVRQLTTTVAELDRYCAPTGPLGAFLTERVRAYSDDHLGWSKPIWDLAPVAFLLDEDWAPADLVPSPILTDHLTWSVDRGRHLIRCTRYVHRDRIFRDVFAKLAAAAAG